MNETLMQLKPVQKLHHLLRDKYGVQLQFSWVADVEKLGGIEEVAVPGSALHIPIQKANNYYGSVIIPKGGNLNPQDQITVSHLVKLVMEPTLSKFYTETHTEASPIPQKSENLIPLTPSALETQFVILTAKQVERAQRVGLEFHDWIGNWAFINYKEISNALTDAKDILTLGQATVFVENFGDLDVKAVETLLQLQHIVGVTMPFFVLVTKPNEDQSRWSMAHTELFNRLKTYQLDVDRLPAQSDRLRGVIELFLERGTEV